MTNQNLPLLGLLAGLLVIPVVIFVRRRFEQRAREQWLQLERTNRKRNIAHYRAWQWLHGKPKPKRLADLRPPEDGARPS
jgi:hypothetical protein